MSSTPPSASSKPPEAVEGTQAAADETAVHRSSDDSQTGPTLRPATQDAALAPGGHPLPDYCLVKRLGKGASGEVWEAVGPGGVPVALKFIELGEQLADAELKSLETVKAIRHPNLMGISGIWQRERWLIIAMELGARTLYDCLADSKKQGHAGLDFATTVEYLRDAARGIDYLNSPDIKIVHRDIKPQNLLLVGNGVKIADFGLAKVLENAAATVTAAMTPAYAAPEFFDGHPSLQSDQYSLAATYVHLRTGRPPFHGTITQVMSGHIKGTPDLSALPALERAPVARALAKEPGDRWPSCGAFVSALERGAAGMSDVDTLPTPPARRHGGQLRQRIAIAALVLFVLLMGVVGWRMLPARVDPLVEMRRQEIVRQVDGVLSHPPVTSAPASAETYREVALVPAEDNPAFEVLGDERIIDLRGWQEVPGDRLHEHVSSVVMSRRLYLKKRSAADDFHSIAKTSGLDVTFDGPRNFPFEVFKQRAESFVGHDRMKVRQAVIDVREIAVGTPFHLDTSWTYWNSLQTESELWFGVVGYAGAFKISQLIVFPDDKPFKTYELHLAKTMKDRPTVYEGAKIVLQDPAQQWLYWEIPSPQTGHVYQLHWTW